MTTKKNSKVNRGVIVGKFTLFIKDASKHKCSVNLSVSSSLSSSFSSQLKLSASVVAVELKADETTMMMHRTKEEISALKKGSCTLIECNQSNERASVRFLLERKNVESRAQATDE